MKSTVKKGLTVTLIIILALWTILVTCCFIFGIKGYHMYRSAVQTTPIQEKISEIQSMEHFVKYDELPQIYIDAVVSVEDHRFYSHPGIDPIAIGRAVWNDNIFSEFIRIYNRNIGRQGNRYKLYLEAFVQCRWSYAAAGYGRTASYFSRG